MKDVILVILPCITTAVSGYLVWVAQQLYGKRGNTSKAVRVLMKRELRQIHSEYMQKGEIPSHVLGDFDEIYEVYHSAGGNGEGTIWKDDLHKLRRT